MTRTVVDSGPGRDMALAGRGRARARGGWVGLGVILYFNRRHVVSFMCPNSQDFWFLLD